LKIAEGFSAGEQSSFRLIGEQRQRGAVGVSSSQHLAHQQIVTLAYPRRVYEPVRVPLDADAAIDRADEHVHLNVFSQQMLAAQPARVNVPHPHQSTRPLYGRRVTVFGRRFERKRRGASFEKIRPV